MEVLSLKDWLIKHVGHLLFSLLNQGLTACGSEFALL